MKNIGEVENKGIELTLSSRNIDHVLKWNMDINFSANRNKVLSLPGGNDSLYGSGPGHLVGLGNTQILREVLGLQNGDGGANDDIMPPMTGIRGADELGWSVCVPSMAVYNTWDDRDYRKEVSFADTALIGGVEQPYTVFQNTKRPHIAKYRRFPGNSNAEGRYSDNNYATMRYAEVLLIAAEALAEINGGPNAEAEGYVNEVRARARNWAGRMTSFPADVSSGLSKNEFITLVLEERRLELAFEFKRWYDIKRRDLGVQVFTGPNSLEPHPNFDPTRDYLMPLPRTELAINPNLLPQNPGY